MPDPDAIPVRLNLEDPDQEAGPLAQLVSSRLRSQGRSKEPSAKLGSDFWQASFFGLDRVRVFQQLNADQQQKVLAGCANGLLSESYFIEKAGMAYCAKMILLADTTETQQVYSLIASDEATHLQWVRPYVQSTDRSRPEGALLNFLSDLIGVCDANTLAFLVQIILEGWGLHHYKALARSCRDPALQAVFEAIHRDEALHHRTGELVFDPTTISGDQKHVIEDGLRLYTELARCGPQQVVTVLEHVCGGFNLQDKTKIFTELAAEETSEQKLGLLRSLMRGEGRDPFLARLDEQGAFTPYRPDACAHLHDQQANKAASQHPDA